MDENEEGKRREEGRAILLMGFSYIASKSWPAWLLAPAAWWIMGATASKYAAPQAAFGGPLSAVPMLPGLALALLCGAALAACAECLAAWMMRAGMRHAAAARPDASAACRRAGGPARRRQRPAMGPSRFSAWAERAAGRLARASRVALAAGIAGMAAACALGMAAGAAAPLGAFGGPLAPPDVASAAWLAAQWLAVAYLWLAAPAWFLRWAAGLFEFR